jgi:transposase
MVCVLIRRSNSSCIMRYELGDFEWATFKPFLPNKPRGFRRDAVSHATPTLGGVTYHASVMALRRFLHSRDNNLSTKFSARSCGSVVVSFRRARRYRCAAARVARWKTRLMQTKGRIK